eukprot:2963951-Pyramimonas_sp.AAC.1
MPLAAEHLFSLCAFGQVKCSVALSDALAEEDTPTHWKKVEEADLKELAALVDHEVFACRARRSFSSTNIFHAVWDRKWKYDAKSKEWI